MASNSFGTLFRFITFGESHGPAVGVVIDGCPAGVHLTADMIDEELSRRAPGQTPYTSPRKEKDMCRLVSGVFEDTTTGAPITIIINNQDADSSKYTAISHLCRPGHANTTYLAKYGIFDYRGGGRASARETAARVAAGAVAKAMLRQSGMDIFAFLAQVGPHKAPELDNELFDKEQIKGSANLSENPLDTIRQHLAKSQIFAPSPEAEKLFTSAIIDTIKQHDSLGGVVRFFITGVPQGLGDPVYDKLSAQLAFALMSIPASKGFEIGQGFASAAATGSSYNDSFTCGDAPGMKFFSPSPMRTMPLLASGGPIPYGTTPSATQNFQDSDGGQQKQGASPQAPSTIRLGSNRAGGILGGISTGNTIYGSVAFKPTPSIGLPQPTLTLDGEEAVFSLPKGSRHDPCLAIRAVPVVEAMCWLVMAEACLKNHVAKMSNFSSLPSPSDLPTGTRTDK